MKSSKDIKNKSNKDPKKSALDNFQLFYEEVPIEQKHERRHTNDTRIRRKSVAA